VSQSEKSSVSEMIGEFLRELAVLIFVFVPLEVWKGSECGRALKGIVVISRPYWLERRLLQS
jgi:hypothetical protein